MCDCAIVRSIFGGVSTKILETGGQGELELGCTVNIPGRGLAVSQELSAATMLILVWDVWEQERDVGVEEAGIINR